MTANIIAFISTEQTAFALNVTKTYTMAAFFLKDDNETLGDIAQQAVEGMTAKAVYEYINALRTQGTVKVGNLVWDQNMSPDLLGIPHS